MGMRFLMLGMREALPVAREFDERVLETSGRAEKRSPGDPCMANGCERAIRAAVRHAGHAPDSIEFRERLASTDRIGSYPYTFRGTSRRRCQRFHNGLVRFLLWVEIAYQGDSNWGVHQVNYVTRRALPAAWIRRPGGR